MGNSIEQKEYLSPQKRILAFVGMPGAGKSEAVSYVQEQGIPFFRFGQITEDGVRSMGLAINPENERMVREKLRNEQGMGVMAILAKPKIDALLADNDTVAIDGLYSWDEYILLKRQFSGLILIHVCAEPVIRYERLSKRPVRPLSFAQSRERDIAEIEKLDKGGPIAIADYLIENNGDDLSYLYQKIDALLLRIGAKSR